MKDVNGKVLENGSIIDLHQTVNGENLFIVLDVESLDIRYGFDINYKYQYDTVSMLSPCHFRGEVEWEIIGNINEYLKSFRKV